MFNQPLAATYFYAMAWEGDTSGDVQDELEQGLAQNNPSKAIIKSLERLEYEAHFQFLRSGFLKPAMQVLKDAGVTEFGTIPPSSQVVFIEYMKRLNTEYIDIAGNKEIDHDKVYRDIYSNMDKWGWAMTLGALLGTKISWMDAASYKQLQVGIAKLVYYLFTDGAIQLDADVMTKFVDEAVTKPVGYVPKRMASAASSGVGSAVKPRPVGSLKAEKFTPTGKLPAGMMKGLTKTKRLTKSHQAYIKSLGSTAKDRRKKQTERSALSPIVEGVEIVSPVSRRTRRSSSSKKRKSSPVRSSYNLRSRKVNSGR